MNVTRLPNFTLPTNLYGRLGLAIVRRFFTGIGVTGTEALANTFSLDPLGWCNGALSWRRIIRWRTLKSRNRSTVAALSGGQY